MRNTVLTSLILALAAIGPALAQSGDPLADRLAYDAEIADQNRRSEALNAEVNRRNREIDARNAAARAAYAVAVAEHLQAKAAYQTALARHSAEVDQTREAHRKAMAEWEAAVAACKAGDRSRCATRSGDG